MSEQNGCCYRYRELAQKYMQNAKDRPMWESFLYGLALTMGRNSQFHREVLQGLKEFAPTRERAKQRCKEGELYAPEKLTNVYSTTDVMKSVCLNASDEPVFEQVGITAKGKPKYKQYPSWGHLEFSMDTCDREGVRKHYIFQQQKGPDMLLLEAGCDVPVLDIWMMRKLVPHEPEFETDFTRWVRRKVQTSPQRYKEYRNMIIAEAEECGVPVGVHHVSCWFDQLFGEDTEKADSYFEDLTTAMIEEEINE
jgi:hypothetical protein